MKALVNCDIFTSSEVITDQALLIEGIRIVGLTPYDAIPGQADVVDLKGSSVCSGLLEMQVECTKALASDDAAFNSLMDFQVAHGCLALLASMEPETPQDLCELYRLGMRYAEKSRHFKGFNIRNVKDLHVANTMIDMARITKHLASVATFDQMGVDQVTRARLVEAGILVIETSQHRPKISPLFQRDVDVPTSSAKPRGQGAFASLKQMVQKNGVSRLSALNSNRRPFNIDVKMLFRQSEIVAGDFSDLVVIDNEMNLIKVILSEKDC